MKGRAPDLGALNKQHLLPPRSVKYPRLLDGTRTGGDGEMITQTRLVGEETLWVRGRKGVETDISRATDVV